MRKVQSITLWEQSLQVLCSNETKLYLREKKRELQLTYDGHEGVKVANVEAFPRHVDEELDDSGSVLLFPRLLTKWRTLKTALCLSFISNKHIYQTAKCCSPKRL